MASISPVSAWSNTRRFELDWLRTFVVLGLIPYHAAVVFAVGPGDYVKSAQRSLVFDVAATLVAFWGMPLLFLVAGAATWHALRVRTPWRYLAERVSRLAIPFVVGVLALVPIQLYIERRAIPGYHQTYAQFYWTFLVDWAHIAQHGVFGLGFQYWGHLWFVLYLLAVSAFLLPCLVWLRGDMAHRALAWFTRFASRNGGWPGLVLLGFPFAGVEVGLQGPIGSLAVADYSNLYSGGAGLILYAVAFVIGYLLSANAQLQAMLVRQRRLALLQAVGLLVLQEVALAVISQHVLSLPVAALAIRAVRGYTTWCWLAALTSYARRYLTAGTPALRYLNEACFPLYVVHMPVLSVVGFFVVRWPLGLLAQFVILVLATAAICFALYEGLVRRLAPLRFLFGLKMSGGQPRHPALSHQRGQSPVHESPAAVVTAEVSCPRSELKRP